MGSINKFYGVKNMGGVNALQYVIASRVEAIPEPNKIVLTGPITFKDGYAWEDLYFTKGSCFYKITSSDTDNGPLSTIQIEGNIPKLTPIIENSMIDIVNDPRIIIRFLDNNRYWRIAGVKELPMKIEFDSSTGKNNREKNGSNFSITGNVLGRVPYYYQLPNFIFPNPEDASVL